MHECWYHALNPKNGSQFHMKKRAMKALWFVVWFLFAFVMLVIMVFIAPVVL
jgi:hypothetical protein